MWLSAHTICSVVLDKRPMNGDNYYCLLLHTCHQTLAHTESKCSPLFHGFHCLLPSGVTSVFVNKIPHILVLKTKSLNKANCAFWLLASLWLWNRNQGLLSAKGNRLTLPPPPPEADGIIYLKRSWRKKKKAPTPRLTCQNISDKGATFGFILDHILP